MSNGIFGIYLANENPGTPLLVWLVLGLIGIGILTFKTLRFESSERFEIIIKDLVYGAVFLLAGFIKLHYGLNIVIGSVLAVLYLYYVIDRKYLIKLE